MAEKKLRGLLNGTSFQEFCSQKKLVFTKIAPGEKVSAYCSHEEF